MAKNEVWLKKALKEVESQMRENNLEGFKVVIKSLDKDAMKVLDEAEGLWEIDPSSKEIREKFQLLRHYLDYLMRFCEGGV